MHDDSIDGIDRAKSQKNFKLRLEAFITYYVSQTVFPIYLSHFSSEWTEIWPDDSLDGIDPRRPINRPGHSLSSKGL